MSYPLLEFCSILKLDDINLLHYVLLKVNIHILDVSRELSQFHVAHLLSDLGG